jgi:hypothetical protein
MNSWTHVAPMAFNEYWLEEVAVKLESVLENTRQEQTR